MPLDTARIATMNTVLLKDLPLDEVLEIHPLLNAQAFGFGSARKVKPIRAKPVNAILDKGQPSILEKVLLSTLEGAQAIKRDAFVCWGVNDDVWQQAKDKLHSKYTPTEVDEDGWITFVPKEGDDAVMNAYQVSAANHSLGEAGGFSIINPWWGDERVMSVTTLESLGIDPQSCGLKPIDPEGGEQVKLYLHYGKDGDWVLQNRKDSADCYRVAKSFFDATYEI